MGWKEQGDENCKHFLKAKVSLPQLVWSCLLRPQPVINTMESLLNYSERKTPVGTNQSCVSSQGFSCVLSSHPSAWPGISGRDSCLILSFHWQIHSIRSQTAKVFVGQLRCQNHCKSLRSYQIISGSWDLPLNTLAVCTIHPDVWTSLHREGMVNEGNMNGNMVQSWDKAHYQSLLPLLHHNAFNCWTVRLLSLRLILQNQELF